MPERSFGRTIRYRRTKLGLSQSKLGDLVGRSAGTIRNWERDQSSPTDPRVLTILAAVLGLEERILYDKAGVTVPERETSPTVEEALASLAPNRAVAEEAENRKPDEPSKGASEISHEPSLDPGEPEPEPGPEEPEPVRQPDEPPPLGEEEAAPVNPPLPAPGYVSPPESFVITAPSPPVGEPSYMEDTSQRQMYRVRNLATLVLLVAMVVVLLWALSNTVSAFGAWWDDFFGQLRL
jgi:transcriptional regulator with XRE-family HTH domain